MPPRIEVQKPVASTAKKTGSVVSRIQPYTPEEADGIKCLIYGRSKTGKSTLASTFPGKILWIITSGGNKKGELRSIALEDRKKIDMVVLDSVMEARDLIKDLRSGSLKYATVVNDHVSGFQDKCLAEIMKVEQLPAQMSWGTASRDQYMECGTTCREIWRDLLSLPHNVVLIGQEKAPKDIGDDSELLLPVVGVDLMPSLAGWLYPACDYIVQTYLEQKTIERKIKIGDKESIQSQKVNGANYCLRTGPHSIYTTGFRSPRGTVIPDHIVNPSYTKIMQIVQGKWKE